MTEGFIAAVTRTPFGRYGGSLAVMRCDDLATIPIRALISRYPKVDWGAVEEVILGCANQAGEDNRNVSRMAVLLSGLPETVPAGSGRVWLLSECKARSRAECQIESLSFNR